MRQSELIDSFLQGIDYGSASNMEIRRLNQSQIALIGYEDMVYAKYDEMDEKVTIYPEWKKTTPKIKKHISTIEAQAGSSETEHLTEDGRPTL